MRRSGVFGLRVWRCQPGLWSSQGLSGKATASELLSLLPGLKLLTGCWTVRVGSWLPAGQTLPSVPSRGGLSNMAACSIKASTRESLLAKKKSQSYNLIRGWHHFTFARFHWLEAHLGRRWGESAEAWLAGDRDHQNPSIILHIPVTFLMSSLCV